MHYFCRKIIVFSFLVRVFVNRYVGVNTILIWHGLLSFTSIVNSAWHCTASDLKQRAISGPKDIYGDHIKWEAMVFQIVSMYDTIIDLNKTFLRDPHHGADKNRRSVARLDQSARQ